MPVKFGVSHDLVLSSLPITIHITHFPKLKKDKAVIHMDHTAIPNIRINSMKSETHISASTRQQHFESNNIHTTVNTNFILFQIKQNRLNMIWSFHRNSIQWCLWQQSVMSMWRWHPTHRGLFLSSLSGVHEMSVVCMLLVYTRLSPVPAQTTWGKMWSQMISDVLF
jgi:hypothetical protein